MDEKRDGDERKKRKRRDKHRKKKDDKEAKRTKIDDLGKCGSKWEEARKKTNEILFEKDSEDEDTVSLRQV